jgi:hypothetical protein
MYLMIIENRLQVILKKTDQYKTKQNKPKNTIFFGLFINNIKYYFFTLQFKNNLFKLQVNKIIV